MSSNLLRLREWLTVAETARHLSNLFEEQVSSADVLRLALDGHLTLSVLFVNHGKGRCGPLVPREDAATIKVPILTKGLKSLGIPEAELSLVKSAFAIGYMGLEVSETHVFEPAERVTTLADVWDLTMLGAERLDVEHEYQLLTGGPAVSLVCLDGVLLCRPDGTHCQVQEHFENNEFADRTKLAKPWDHPSNFYPAGSLPKDAVWVVRTAALHDLMTSLSGQPDAASKPLERRERATLLVVIAALAKLAKIDVAKPSSAAAAIESQTALLGARVAGRTIENHLNRIPEALQNRADV